MRSPSGSPLSLRFSRPLISALRPFSPIFPVASLGSSGLACGYPFVRGPACLLPAPSILAKPLPSFFALPLHPLRGCCVHPPLPFLPRPWPRPRWACRGLLVLRPCRSCGLSPLLPLCPPPLCCDFPTPLPPLSFHFRSPHRLSGPRFVLWALVLRPRCPRPLPVRPGAFTSPLSPSSLRPSFALPCCPTP